MPEVRITVGGREFDVACQPGEEHFLRAAARLLDAEATALVSQIGRMPELRMLLMAGLMLADKTAAVEDQLRAAEERATMAERALERARATSVRAEVAALPEDLAERFAGLAAEAEALATRIEGRAA
ncbi:MAG: cell division protein ZapA [Rhodobacteraceae bacterium]|nr:cell division protein ZapA [Paracoccaceae bacterium]